jgi:pSer/pThr/pTyr-binding forkhead associated (FHA) protein
LTISICVISDPSKGLTYQFSKPLTSVGRTGGRADIQIDDPSLADLHCAMGVRQDVFRLCDLDSTTGIYINHERVQTAELEHLSEFRVGSSLLLVTILPKCKTANT